MQHWFSKTHSTLLASNPVQIIVPFTNELYHSVDPLPRGIRVIMVHIVSIKWSSFSARTVLGKVLLLGSTFGFLHLIWALIVCLWKYEIDDPTRRPTSANLLQTCTILPQSTGRKNEKI